MPPREAIPSDGLHALGGQARVIIDGRQHYLGRYNSEESRAESERHVRKLLTDSAAKEMQDEVRLTTDMAVNELAVSTSSSTADLHRPAGVGGVQAQYC